MKIHGFIDGGACGLIRICQPLDALRDLGGHEVSTSCGWYQANKETINAADILIGQRLDRPTAATLWRMLSLKHKLVYEIDDDTWAIDETNWQAARLRKTATQDMIEACIEASHLITVSTEPLAEIVSAFNSNVEVLPNCIEGRMLELERPRRDKVVVGWAGGSSHIPDMAMVLKPLKRVLHQHPEVEFHNIGFDFRELMGVEGRYTDWSMDLFTYYASVDFDIALCPLVRSRFNRSKSGIKAMEASALGIPVIASDVEPYKGVIEHGVTGFLVSHEHQWVSCLRKLIADKSMREAMGAAGRERAREWTFEANWKRWETAYAGLLSKRAVLA